MLPHNQQTLNEVITYTNKNQNCCVVNPCGSGKTSIMAAFIALHPSSTFVIITKQKNAANYYKNRDTIFAKKNVTIVTYNTMYNNYKNNQLAKYNTTYLLIDEAHYIGASKWNQAFTTIQNKYRPITIGFTATPQRFCDQGTNTTIVTNFFDGNSAGNFSTRDLQKQGIFVEPKYILSLYDIEQTIQKQIEKIAESNLDQYIKEMWYDKLDNIVEDWKTNAYPQTIINENLPNYMYKPACNRILVYVPTITDISTKQQFIDSAIQQSFPNKSIKSYVYTYKTSEEEFQKFLQEDDTYIKILYSIDKIMETIHIDDLRITIMLRPSISNRIITQQFGRLNSINNQKQPLIIDMVDNLSRLSNDIEYHVNQDNRQKKNEDAQVNPFYIHIPSYLSKYNSVFKQIDKTIRTTPHYTYEDFTGTLRELCIIYNVDYQKAKEYIQTHDIQDTIQDLQKPFKITKKIFNDTETFEDIKLSNEQRQYATDNMHIVENFIKNHNIQDDDIKQNLYIKYLQTIVKTDSSTKSKAYKNIRIITDMKNYYIRLLRNKHMRESCFVNTANIFQNTYYEINPLSYNKQEHLSNTLKTLSSTLSKREIFTLQHYYGFIDGKPHTLEQTGKQLNVTRERVRQILSKGERKLRQPKRAHQLLPHLELFDNPTENVIHINNTTMLCNQSLLQLTNIV